MLNQISFEVFVTLMFYWSEKAKKQNFLETNQKIQQLSLHHDIINKLIPSSMIILQFKSKSDYKILYANQSCLETFRIKDISQLDEILRNVTVDKEYREKKDKIVSVIEDSYLQLFIQNSISLPQKRKDIIKEVDIVDILTSDKLFHHKDMYFNARYSHCYFQNELSALIFLSDETIQRKNEYLKQMNIYKDKLLARISHDLKTPLNCILSISQNFKNHLSNISSFQNDMDIISKNSQLLMHMINDILDYSQIKMQKLKLNCQQFNVRRAILDIFRLVQQQADSQNIQLIAEVNNSLEIFNDENRFKQVILNFIQNSIQYTPSGFIKVKCQRIDLTNELQVSIIDTGKGMDQETIDRLFCKIGTFNKTHLNVDGVGLGLIMSKKLIGFIGHKSSIQVESKLLQGSTFTFSIRQNLKSKQTSNLKIAQTMISVYQTRATQSLSSNQLEKNDSPCNISPTINIEQQFNEDQESLDNNSDLQNQIDENLSQIQAMNEFKTNSFQPSINEETKKLKVMIVDDIYYNIIALKAYLKNFTNLEISEFIFAEDAFLEIQKNQYDIIFSDIQMPIMDGIEFITKVRLLKDKIKQPIVFMISADNQQAHEERLRDLEIQSFIQKPILNQQSFNNLVSSSLIKL
ncbi:ATPase, histidine kinase-, DNA gyrase B (macronuclear) [Tetrahymena thermophila SB210]|uniref:ATPase, histidine kinase-, DNA gyrase B n=1 Tax=Tetrahymena thermophila (strain SB210) TaxID=312017 RepID=Q231B3_TETTS|nr:ATPase, histidine kinase-, DNA gyrase B [Tetrahymena thermophila SB210]EAR91126.2 ATPase, histidine kinase-, DNA gyrase B [Tetrahymena thermophila SB210]|eukprot:XP_001011371.2 ATPase, histidine kinase-, DNA gyrase B [Tetrahymena thermophila SB210]